MATLIAVYGVGLVTPLGWMYAGIVWAYAFACFLITDPVKLLAYKVLDTVKADTRPSAEAEPKPDANAQPHQVTKTVKADAKPVPKADPEPDAKAKQVPDAKAEPESRPTAKLGSAAKGAPDPLPDSGSQPATEPVPQPAETNAKVTALLDTKLRDVLLAAVLKDPADGGRLIAKAISDAETPAAAAKPTEAKPATPAAPAPQAAA